MTEKEKMIASLCYNSMDEELRQARAFAKDLCFKFNQTLPSLVEEQAEFIQNLFGKIKSSFFITAPFYCDYGYNIEIGDNFYANHNCVILDCAKVSFGDNVFIAPNCCFSAATHPINANERNSGQEFAYPITVGNNVWFGASVTVLPGVTIGDNVVIGAGSVLTKDIPANSVAYGNPCKVARAMEK